MKRQKLLMRKSMDYDAREAFKQKILDVIRAGQGLTKDQIFERLGKSNSFVDPFLHSLVKGNAIAIERGPGGKTWYHPKASADAEGGDRS